MENGKKFLFWNNDLVIVPTGWHLVNGIAGNSSRTAYINTGYVPTIDTRIECDATFEPDANNGWLFATEDYYHNT